MFSLFSNLISFFRFIGWYLLGGVRANLSSRIGPYSILRKARHGAFICSGRITARDSLRVYIEGKISIDGNVFFNSNVSINCLDNISIGSDCLFGEQVKIYDHDHRYGMSVSVSTSGFTLAPVKIGNNVWVGSNVVILKGVTIGDNSVIAAGSVVNRDVPSNTLFYSGVRPKLKSVGAE